MAVFINKYFFSYTTVNGVLLLLLIASFIYWIYGYIIYIYKYMLTEKHILKASRSKTRRHVQRTNCRLLGSCQFENATHNIKLRLNFKNYSSIWYSVWAFDRVWCYFFLSGGKTVEYGILFTNKQKCHWVHIYFFPSTKLDQRRPSLSLLY